MRILTGSYRFLTDLPGDALYHQPRHWVDGSALWVIEGTLGMVQTGQGSDLLLRDGGFVGWLEGQWHKERVLGGSHRTRSVPVGSRLFEFQPQDEKKKIKKNHLRGDVWTELWERSGFRTVLRLRLYLSLWSLVQFPLVSLSSTANVFLSASLPTAVTHAQVSVNGGVGWVITETSVCCRYCWTRQDWWRTVQTILEFKHFMFWSSTATGSFLNLRTKDQICSERYQKLHGTVYKTLFLLKESRTTSICQVLKCSDHLSVSGSFHVCFLNLREKKIQMFLWK